MSAKRYASYTVNDYGFPDQHGEDFQLYIRERLVRELASGLPLSTADVTIRFIQPIKNDSAASTSYNAIGEVDLVRELEMKIAKLEMQVKILEQETNMPKGA